MRLLPFRPRFTMRRLMVAVAILAVALGLVGWMLRRAATFRLEATAHLERARLASTRSPADLKSIEHHQILFIRFDRAARHPWLPVEPDPPEPK